MKIEEAIEWMEEAVQETTECFEECSPALQKELIEQKEVFELAITALHSMPEVGEPELLEEKQIMEHKNDHIHLVNAQTLPDGSILADEITAGRVSKAIKEMVAVLEHKELTTQLRRMSVQTGIPTVLPLNGRPTVLLTR